MESQWRNPRETTTPEAMFTTNNYTKNPFPRETIKARALTSWGLCHMLWPSCAQGATCSRAMVVLPGDSGGTTLRNSNSSNSSRRFSSTLTCSLAPAKEDDVLPCPHFYSAPSPRDAQHVTPPPLAPSGLTSATRGLSWNH